MVKDLNKEDRQKLDAALFARSTVYTETGELQPPSWWHGEEEASRTMAAALGVVPGRPPRR